MDEASLAACKDNACFPQCHQVLRQVRLPPAKGCLEVADAGLALTDGQQDLQACWLVDALHQARYFFNGRYIHNHEYIIVWIKFLGSPSRHQLKVTDVTLPVT